MNNYLIHFATYTFAMIGFIVMALFIYKKAVYTPINSKNKDFLKVETSMKLSASKTVYVIRAGEEKFLIAGDSSNTTMLAKLNSKDTTFDYEKPAYTEKLQEIPYMKKIAQRINRG